MIPDEVILVAIGQAAGHGKVSLQWINNNDEVKPTDVARRFAEEIRRAALEEAAQAVAAMPRYVSTEIGFHKNEIDDALNVIRKLTTDGSSKETP